MPELHLLSHPATPFPAVRTFNVRMDRVSAERLVFYYRIEGDIDALQLPPQQRSAHADELWKHTCFEAFLRPRGAKSYVEFNFSPSSAWAVYAFDGYRRGMRTVEPAHPPKIVCRRRDGELDADVDVHLGGLGLEAGEIDVAIAAVLRAEHGGVSYWALAHPTPAPDFHHAKSFIAAAPAPESAD